MKIVINKNRMILASILPTIFGIINYYILKVEFNLIEFIMISFISLYCVTIYEKNHDYLDPRLFFPILYFLFYWLGDFGLILYEPVPKNIWWLYLTGICGYFLGSEFAQRSTKVNMARYNIEKEKDYITNNGRIAIFLIFLVCVLAKIYMFRINGIPLLASNIDASRQSMSESFGAVKAIAYGITIVPIYSFYDIISRKKRKMRMPLANILMIIISIGLTILDVSRLPLIQMGISMLIIFILKVKRIPLNKIAILVFLVFIFIGANQIMRNIRLDSGYLAYISLTRNTNMFENIMLSCFNTFRVGIDDFYKITKEVPSNSGYTYGMLFLNSIISPLPGKQITVGFYVAKLLGLSFDGIGAASTILGMFYIDGGIFLIFVGMFLLGAFIQYFYKKYLMKNTLTLFHLIAVYVIFYSINTLRTNVMPTIEPLMAMIYYSGFSYLLRKIR